MLSPPSLISRSWSFSLRWFPALAVLALVLVSGCDGVVGTNDADDSSFTTEIANETLSADAPSTKEIDQGQYGNIENGLQLLIRNETEYADIWVQLHGHRESTPDRPPINFEEESLVVIVMEPQRTGGYAVNIDEALLNEDGDQAQIRYTEVSPGENCSVTMAMTSPYVLATIDAPVDNASFEASADVHSCTPAE